MRKAMSAEGMRAKLRYMLGECTGHPVGCLNIAKLHDVQGILSRFKVLAQYDRVAANAHAPKGIVRPGENPSVVVIQWGSSQAHAAVRHLLYRPHLPGRMSDSKPVSMQEKRPRHHTKIRMHFRRNSVRAIRTRNQASSRVLHAELPE